MIISPIFTIFVCASFQQTHSRLIVSSYHDSRDIRKSCTSTQDCPTNRCCRNRDGDLIGVSESGWGLLSNASNAAQGTCSAQKSGPGQFCLLSCGCTDGYECYRTLTGVCCPPMTCWRKEDAEADREFWRNCRPPTCHFPPSANPGN